MKQTPVLRRASKKQSPKPKANLDMKKRSFSRAHYQQQIDKYNNLAKVAASSGDRVLAEYNYQHADHYQRLLNEREDLEKQRIESLEEERNKALSIMQEDDELKDVS